jgi:hypothetical protein
MRRDWPKAVAAETVVKIQLKQCRFMSRSPRRLPYPHSSSARGS